MKSIGLTAILLMLASGTALAAEDGGFYLSAGVGQFNLEEDDFAELTADDFDADDTSLKLFAGWRFNPYFAAPASACCSSIASTRGSSTRSSTSMPTRPTPSLTGAWRF